MRHLLLPLFIIASLLSSTQCNPTDIPADPSSPDTMDMSTLKTDKRSNMPDELPGNAFDISLNSTSRARSIHRFNPLHYRLTSITFAANDYAILYINGRQRRSVHHYRRNAFFRANLRVGTVVVIKVTNRHSWGGLIAAFQIRRPYFIRRRIGMRTYRFIRYRRYALLSGRFPFRMRKAYPNRRLNYFLKIRKRFSCRWPTSRRVRIRARHISRSFPYRRLRARYVWARGAHRVGTVFLRVVIGGERCHYHPPNPKPSRRPRPSRSPPPSRRPRPPPWITEKMSVPKVTRHFQR